MGLDDATAAWRIPTGSPTASSWPDRGAPPTPLPAPASTWPARSPGLSGYPDGPPQHPPTPGAPDADERRSPSTGRVAVVAALVGAVVSGLVVAGALTLAADDPAPTTSVARQLSGEGLDIRALLDRAQPSVVSISTGQSTSRGVFGGAGSGVVIDADGLILTNAHVISGATRMEVTLYDGDVRPASLVASSPEDDIALVRVDDPTDMVPAELGSSGAVEVGDDVVAIGNALNLGGPPSVTQGIISAKDRTIQAPGDLVLRNLIQTDAAINPGNSGGPLLDADGRVVGINTAIIDDAQSIGFAIAIDPIKPLIDDLAAGNGLITPDSAFLGVSMMSVDEVLDSVLEEYGVDADDGAFVSDLVPDSAASEAGLELGDVIVEIDGSPVADSDEAAAAIREREAGDRIAIVVERDGERLELEAELRSRADSGG